MNAKARVPFKEYWQMTATYVRPEWRRVALLTALIFTTLGLQLVNPQIIRFFINSAQDGGATAPLIWAGVAFLGSALLLQVVQVCGAGFRHLRGRGRGLALDQHAALRFGAALPPARHELP
jgi:hypothetical protein